MTKKIKLLSLFIFITTVTYAQYGETIRTGRPGQANGAFSAGKNVYQVQSGLNIGNSTLKANPSLEGKTEVINQNSVFRIGVTERFELRAAYGYNFKDKFTNVTNEITSERNGFNTVAIGFRQNFLKQKGIIPTMAIQFTNRLVGSGKDYRYWDNYSLESRILLGHRITKKLNLNTNLSTIFGYATIDILYRYVFSFGYSVTDKFGVTAEIYGTYVGNDIFGNKVADLNILTDFGVSYLISNDFSVDIYGGYSINDRESVEETAYFISAGFSYRLVRRN